MSKGPRRHATIVGFSMREGTNEWEKAMRTEVLWASAYAARGDLVGCTATLHHPDRSESRNASSSQPKRTHHLVIPTEAKRRDLLFAWIAAAKLRNRDALRSNDTKSARVDCADPFREQGIAQPICCSRESPVA